MSDQMPVVPPPPAPSEPEDRKHGVSNMSWVAGVVLIALGITFMAQQRGFMIGNWWAVFIYIAAFANFANMWRSWRKEGRFTNAATGSLTGGLLLTAIASIFMFNLAWDLWWPLILISLGVGIVAGSLLSRR